jgi:large subunit ribosomal protein L6
MSRIGKRPVPLPNGVTATVEGKSVKVKGPKGELKVTLVEEIDASVGPDGITIKPRAEMERARRMWGMSRSLVNNLVVGVTQGFSSKLEIQGVGYRAAVQGKNLNLQLGFSHDVAYPIPAGITITAEKPTMLTVSGADKQLVGQVAAEIRAYRKPEPYKGKGVRYAVARKARRSRAMPQNLFDRRKNRTRFRIRANAAGRPRLSVFRSGRHIYAQIIDDRAGQTVAAASSNEKEDKAPKTWNMETATAVGKKIAERALAKGVKQVVFDRGGYIYHGRIKALADAAREGGLEF